MWEKDVFLLTSKSIYDNEPFIKSREIHDAVLLPKIGRFCKCGCNKRLESRVITKKLKSGRTITFRRGPIENQEFLDRTHRNHYHYKTEGKTTQTSVVARINLPLNRDGTRTITVYLGRKEKYAFEVNSNQKLLWDFLNKLGKFRGYLK